MAERPNRGKSKKGDESALAKSKAPPESAQPKPRIQRRIEAPNNAPLARNKALAQALNGPLARMRIARIRWRSVESAWLVTAIEPTKPQKK